ncbi:outer membrane lipoprotein LolB [Pigmentiphaga sp.]|uniref:outer membrane lipoprotein LolB n=1 Tax=Pigmentiphaga sp. TaxID=1977564 RepID=UPI0025EDD538|nr:outer membrane lipoprotein LolB [Pigmentiphaga sp.]MBX6318973.1 outer membrane lipoprotein LolB [Pigmentiphaga sp.]
MIRCVRLGRAVAAAGFVALLAACAAPAPIQAPPGAETREALSRVGRFALRVEEAGGKQHAVQGGFAWRDDGSRLALDLVSPLGATLARVEAGPGEAVLRESNGRETRAGDPDALVGIVLGNDIPVSGLRDWLRGRVAPRVAANVARRDELGRPLVFEQAGWHVTAQQYDALGPTRLHMARQEGGQEVDLRLVISPDP